MNIGVSYRLTLQPGDPLERVVRRGLASNSFIFTSVIEGSDGCYDCEPYFFGAPTIKQVSRTSSMVVSSIFKASCLCQYGLQIVIPKPSLEDGKSYQSKKTKWTIFVATRESSIVSVRGVIPIYQTSSKLRAERKPWTENITITIDRTFFPSIRENTAPTPTPTPTATSKATPKPNTSLINGYEPLAPAIFALLVLFIVSAIGVRILARELPSLRIAFFISLVGLITFVLDAVPASPVSIPLPVFRLFRVGSIAWWALLPVLILIFLLSYRRPTRHSLRPIWVALIPVAIILGVLAIFSATELPLHHAILVLGAAVVAVALPALALVVVGLKRWAVAGAVIGALLVSAPIGIRLLGLRWVPGSWWMIGGLVVLGLLWVPVLQVAADDVAGLRQPSWWLAYAAVGGLLYLPVISLLTRQNRQAFHGWAFLFYPYYNLPYMLTYVGTDVLVAVIILGLVLLLRNLGGKAEAESNRLAVAAGVFLVASAVSPIVSLFKVSLTDVLSSVAALVTFRFLLLSRRSTKAVLLASIDKAMHAQLMRRMLRERIIRNGKRDLYRIARRNLAGGDLSISDFESRLHALEDERYGSKLGQEGTSPVLHRAVLGGSAGFSPWQNGVFGAVVALGLGSPIIIFDLYSFRDPLHALALAQGVAVIRHTFRWAAYGLFYGYFYPRIHGSAPIPKALFLLIAILPPELFLLLSPQTSPAANLGVATLLKTGEVVVFCISLGLIWEIRLTYAAGLPWGTVRDFRSFTSLGTPLTALLVAATTAVATVLAGAATAALLHAPLSSIHIP